MCLSCTVALGIHANSKRSIQSFVLAGFWDGEWIRSCRETVVERMGVRRQCGWSKWVQWPQKSGKKASAVAIWGALVASLSLDASFVGKMTAIHWSAHQWDMSVWGIFLRSRMRKPNKTEHITRLSNASRHRKSTWSSNVVSKLHSQLSIRSPSGLVTGRVPSYTCRLS